MNLIIKLFGSWQDFAALIVFICCWLGYEPVVKRVSQKSGVIFKDLTIVRRAWMKEMVIRSFKLYDSNLIGHGVNSMSFFASANLILIAAVAGAIFTEDLSYTSVHALGIDTSSSALFLMKFGLVIVCLARGLLNFIWALRQTNYAVAAMGAIPENVDEKTGQEFSAAVSDIFEPAMSNFSQGVRGYYFSLAAAAWLFGPIPLAIASIGATILLAWRQSRSQAARGLRRMRELLEDHPYPTRTRPIYDGLKDIDAETDTAAQPGAPENENASGKSV
ncbi:DUF599 family protein [Asticcacaulis sp. BYS171W]|uniref:DUF599 family protein n=1 Tax=Asticcacaulis aquaticus TaxID=2984212 RepID=A0ABT5HR72_9CAUL|nr:DUF599 family protein [Asticcacaulis aquaticus]MDC7682563.1 DUF599 family protein [Asticcacaulis aquaticus]